MSKRRVLITGGAGFIGSHACDHWHQLGYRSLVVDNFVEGSSEKNVEGIANFNIFRYDLRDTDEILKICKELQPQWVLNFAAQTHVDRSIDNCIPFAQSNVEGVASLLEVCKQTNIPLLHVSTDEVYGPCYGTPFEEGDHFNPQNPYAATKAAAEHLVSSFCNTHGLDYVIVRPSNNFGPRQAAEKMIPKILSCLKKGEKIPLYGDGLQEREWLFVKDTVRMIYELTQRVAARNRVYNLRGGTSLTNRALIERIFALKFPGESLEACWSKHVVNVPDRKNHDRRYSIHGKRFDSLVSIFMQTNFQEALKETISYYESVL